MSIIISIDVRECDLWKCIQPLCAELSNIKVESKNLELGDVLISYVSDDGAVAEILVIERKTIMDLASSIHDGRYKEQSYRLFHHSIPNHNIMYIIEGDMSMYNPRFTSVSTNALASACISLQYYKGFSVHKSKNVQETKDYVLQFSKKVLKDKSFLGFYNGDGKSVYDDVVYTDVVKKRKKDNITPENVGVLLLSQVPSVSDIMAKAILKEFTCFRELINKVHENKDILNSISYQTSTGKTRKIPKNVKENIIKYLCE